MVNADVSDDIAACIIRLRLFSDCHSLNMGAARDTETLIVIYQARFAVLTRLLMIQVI